MARGMKATMKIAGLRETLAGLEQFKKSTARGVLERVLKRAIAPMEQAAKSMAPVKSGGLRDSIKTVVVRSSAGKSAYAAAIREGASADVATAAAKSANRGAKSAGKGASAKVRVQATAPHAHLVEWGTAPHLAGGRFKGADHPGTYAQPFMGPAYNGGRREATLDIKADLKREIETTARRVAARAAKRKSK